MIDLLIEPFSYDYMVRAIFVTSLVGVVCALLSCFLILRGWSLMGDALAHSIVPGVVLAYILAVPYAIGAFFSGMLAAISMIFVRQKTKLREDVVIGLIFTSFFAAGMVMISIWPVSVSVQTIVLGNVLAIPSDILVQVCLISLICLICIAFKWRDLMLVCFDEKHAKAIGLPVGGLQIVFFTVLSAMAVAALQTVGACLVIAMVVTPGATAYLYTDRFSKLLVLSCVIAFTACFLGVYASYFMNVNPGGLVVCLQTLFFIASFVFAPKYGVRAQRRTVSIAEFTHVDQKPEGAV